MNTKDILPKVLFTGVVAANTIEEKIVALHNQKSALPDSLLEDADTSTLVSADDLMELLREVG